MEKVTIRDFLVSTHSRPKAAGSCQKYPIQSNSRFNTQPPEGGWGVINVFYAPLTVSTHSRPKAAGFFHAAV